MKLNYIAYPHPNGEAFAYYAKDDADALEIVREHLEGTKSYRATIFRWDEEGKDWDFRVPLTVALEDPKVLQKSEYKLVTRYVRYVEFIGVSTKDRFSEKAQAAAERLDTLPTIPGCKKFFRAEEAHFTDDERYGVKDIPVVELES